MGYSEALVRLASSPPAAGEKKDRDQRILQMAGKFRGQLKHLERLTDDLLDMARLQSGKFSLQTRPVDLSRVAEQAIEESRLAAPEREIRLEAQKDGAPLTVQGDEERLVQVLNNLLNNAIKHAPQSDRIDITLSRSKSNDGAAKALVEVRDYGPGIPPEKLGTVFNRFYQISEDNQQPQTGLGLGLYIAKGIIEQHQGAIAVQSVLGKGSAFIIELPLVSET
jgi:signal transduction histidine kinase